MRQEQPLFCESTSQEADARETLNHMLGSAPLKSDEELKQDLLAKPVP